MREIEGWFKEYYPMLLAYASKMVQDQESAKEIVQELFLSLFEKQASLTQLHSPKAYLFQAVRNRCLNHLKKNKQQKQVPLQEGNAIPDRYANPMEAAELEYQLYVWIDQLPPACKRVFRMSRFEGKKNQDIADALDISKRTVETQISKALRILRERLEKSNWNEGKRAQLLSIFL